MSPSDHPSAPPGGALLGRREFLRRMGLLALAGAAAPLLAACDLESATPTVPPPLTPIPSEAVVPPALPTGTPPPPAPAATDTPTAGYPDVDAPTPSPVADAPVTDTPEPVAAAPTPVPAAATGPHDVAVLRATDRATAVPAALALLGFAPGWLRGKSVALKANFNSADPPPGSTHLDTLRALIEQLQAWGAVQITLVERSGMGDTRAVLQSRGVFALAGKLDVRVVVLDELGAKEWVKMEGAHWRRGFLFPRVVQEADVVVQTCCLKTHRFGGHFTLSLKNSVGLAAKYDPTDHYNYMAELHGSPNQRLMIAEINAAYQPALILLDGVSAFTSGGPEAGQAAQAGLVLAGRDRVAVDAAGVAMLRELGTTAEVSKGSIFSQAQLARAVALGLGAPSAQAVVLRPAADPASEAVAATLQRRLLA